MTYMSAVRACRGVCLWCAPATLLASGPTKRVQRALIALYLYKRVSLRGTVMPNFINLPPFTEDGDIHVVVETPRGSRANFVYDPKLETFVLSKSLLTGLTYS